MNESPVVLGAGLAGLGCALHLPGARIYESASHPGGHIWSHTLGGATFDEGAHICHSKDESWLKSLFAQAGDVVHMPTSRVANWWHGHWVTYPVQNHLNELPMEARAAALTGFVQAQGRHAGKTPANYDEWCRFQYGDYLADHFYKEYTDKYWRVSMAELGTDWLAGRLLPSQVERIVRGALQHQEEQQSVFASFHYPARGGFYSFFKDYYKQVPIELGCRAVAVDPRARVVLFASGQRVKYSRLVSTLPLNDLAAMTAGAPDAVRDAAKRLRCTQLICVNMIIRKPALAPHHWFYIYDPAIDVSRVKILSNIAPLPELEGCTVLQAEVYRRDNEAVDLARIKQQAVTDIAALLGFDPETELVAADTVHVRHAYIISDLARAASVDLVRDWFRGQGIETAGLVGAWQFIWSDKAFQAGRDAALRVQSS